MTSGQPQARVKTWLVKEALSLQIKAEGSRFWVKLGACSRPAALVNPPVDGLS